MKKICFILMLCIGVLSCKKEDKVCPQNYTGSNCDKEVAPVRVRITRVQFTNFPGTNDGKQWDINSVWPEPYFQISDLSGTIFQSEYLDEKQPGTISQWNVDITVIPSNPYVILFYDEDGAVDDYIDGWELQYYIQGQGFPDRYTFTGERGSQISVWVVYEY